MLSAIDLDDETPLATDEVHVIWADRLLAHKLEAAEAAIAKRQPQDPLGPCALPPKRTGARRRSKVGTSHPAPPHPGPLPPCRERGRGIRHRAKPPSGSGR